jgi:hypothetical protein
MFYEDIKKLSAAQFKRLTGVKKEVFAQMLEVVTTYKQSNRKHRSRGVPPKLSYADKILLMLMYYREYRTQFHIGVTYGIAESTVCEIIKDIETILIKDKGFHLPGKKALLQQNHFEVVMVDVTESPVERPQKNNAVAIPAKRNGTRRRHN